MIEIDTIMHDMGKKRKGVQKNRRKRNGSESSRKCDLLLGRTKHTGTRGSLPDGDVQKSSLPPGGKEATQFLPL